MEQSRQEYLASLFNKTTEYENSDPEKQKVQGFLGGVEAGAKNFANIVVPNLYGGYIETSGITASLGAGLGNPVNIATAFIPGGIVAGAAYGAVGNTVTDFVSRKVSDDNAQFSYAQLAEEFVGGAAIGGAIKAAIPAVKGAIGLGKEAIGKAKAKSSTNIEPTQPLPDVTDKVDLQFVNKEVIQNVGKTMEGISTMHGTDVNLTNPLKGLDDLSVNTLVQQASPKIKPISKEVDSILNSARIKTGDKQILARSLEDTDPAVTKYLNDYFGSSKEAIKKDYMGIYNAVSLKKLYPEPEELGKSFNNLQYLKRNEYSRLVDSQLTPDVYNFLNDKNNKLSIFEALFKKTDNQIANKAAAIIRSLNNTITSDINRRSNIGFIENRFGAQIWNKSVVDLVPDKTFYQDLINSGYKIKNELGELVEITEEIAKSIKNNLTIDNTSGFYKTIDAATGKERILITDNPVGAFNVETKYGGDRNPFDIIMSDIYGGAKKTATADMFGDDLYKTLGVYSKIIDPEKATTGIPNLLSYINLPTQNAEAWAQRTISSLNAVWATGRAIKTAVNPLWQMAFAMSETFGGLGTAFGKYGMKVFKGTNLQEIKQISKEMQKYTKLDPSFTRQTREIIRNSLYHDNDKLVDALNRYSNKVLNKDAIINGSHLADSVTRNVTGMFHGIGIKNHIKAGGTLGNIDRKYIMEAMGKDNLLPDSQILRKKGDSLRAENKLAADDYYKNAAQLDIVLQEAINNVSPLAQRNIFGSSKLGLNTLMPLRMANWVLNSFANIQLRMWNIVYKNIREQGAIAGGIGNAETMRQIGGLSIFAGAISLSETLFDVIREPKKFEKDGEVEKALAKNFGIGLVLGQLYIPVLAYKAGYTVLKSGYDWLAADNTAEEEKARDKIIKNTSLNTINFIHKGLD